ncbi:MAG: 4-(cytidine 5'-diphospho)-2-C-methyl-D-erythritol kinase [Bacteroidota bacterium]
MILFSPAKVNIGLHITGRRPDGFHNLQSVMVPIGLCDILEIRQLRSRSRALHFSQSGIPVDGDPGKNLVEKAFEIMSGVSDLPPVEIHLHKQIPVGAGLGGGSSNASVTLKGLNQLIPKPLSPEKLQEMAAHLGSDCPFFLYQKPMFMEGRGEILSQVSLGLEDMTMVVLFPHSHISTAMAYAGVEPLAPMIHLRELIAAPIEDWKLLIINDFEKGIFQKYPELEIIKQGLYKSGAIYASLSGSGSSLFGIFNEMPNLPPHLSRFVIWKGEAGKLPAPI